MNNIDHIMYLINWSRNEEEQRKGISLAQEVTCIKAFFRPIGPGYSKNVWENCAIILCARSDEELKPYILDMLLWLEDLNWPGAELIQERLCQFKDVDWLVMRLEQLVPILNMLDEKSWLSFLSTLLTNQLVRNKLNKDTISILLKYFTDESC